MFSSLRFWPAIEEGRVKRRIEAGYAGHPCGVFGMVKIGRVAKASMTSSYQGKTSRVFQRTAPGALHQSGRREISSSR